ncbi:RNA degradosome polyphosphate kinase [Bombella saccharophila]|uniref:Polyphosphate kinase n=1 Tax=Bombella saccharophila TaxID=2967338 RepID=A0ABT3W5L1_9PROT|nr:RNA degradosome polyphosphate kinase [Bombella saccharophila]MCX5613983.1 RNA degradosome polyphosphate kinase [Bombella saccharophila]PHI97594.1 RNA degradosome polyphosphate kinase [Parasaccharibacter apium]
MHKYHHLAFINRELSWLDFNQRVLEEAEDLSNPLLERVRFLSISAGNMDEFYAVRVAGLIDQVHDGATKKSVDGLTPTQQLETVRYQAWCMQQEQQRIWHGLRAELAKENIVIESIDKLHHLDKAWLKEYFEGQVYPVLTPVDLNPTHPLPFIPSGGQALVLRLRETDSHKHKADGLVVMPPQLPRFIRLPDKQGVIRFIALEYVIAHFSKSLFPGMHSVPTGMMRIVRNLDVELEEDAEDLLNNFENAVKERRRGACIHLEVEGTIPKHVIRKLGLERDEVVLLPKMAGMGDVKQLIVSDRPELLFPPFHAAMPQRVVDHGGDCFATIKEKDLVVQHPYESYDVVVHFLQQAAQDPDVISIKQSIYRTSHDSPIVHALIAAVEAGKSVTAVVELRARFDEEANIRLARALETRGVQVVYGLAAYKTHAKMILVVRREGERLQSYAHFGTGNYHPSTAKIYTDISFFTCNPVLVEDAARLFNYTTGCAEPHLQALCCSPLTIRPKLEELVHAEMEHARAGRPAQIWLKMNSLVDPQLIELLYDASQAGVSIKAVVRGICCLRPGVKGLSDNIEVHSIVGRYLEHARVFAFGNGQALPSESAKLYISSADWMKRNMDRRIEAMVPITDPAAHAHILNQIMVVNLRDTLRSWKMTPEGKWERMAPGSEPLCAHDYFMAHPSPAYGAASAPVAPGSRAGAAVQES